MNKVQDYSQAHQERYVQELIEWLKIPSVSADPVFAPQVHEAASWLVQELKCIGMQTVDLYPTDGFPVVFASHHVGDHLPTVLVYGHYDVQPPTPLELWTSPPFEPQIRDGKIYARGACDDKGQVYMHVKALESMLATGSLPCNVKLMVEGEEEIGSNHLEIFVKSHQELLKADVILISDTAMIANDTPSIDCGLRGLSYVEVEVTGPNRDLHSGVYGGAVVNPIQALCTMINSLKDDQGRITIPSFYDQVDALSQEERGALALAPFDEKVYQKDLDVSATNGEQGYSTTERATIRPTLDVNGIWGGYIGEGAKTVLPSKAFAKISMRLVPHQDSATITHLFSKHFESVAPAGVKVVVKPHHGGEPVVTPMNSPGFLAASKAMEQTFGKTPIPTRGGGSIPIVALFESALGIKSVLMGFGLDSDNIHSPDEHFGLFNFYKGIETIPWFYEYYREEMEGKV